MEKEIKNYQRLNAIATTGGVVIFGENADKDIPVAELKESFNLEYSAYNRSFTDLNLENAIELYDSCVKELLPDTVMIHIGSNSDYWENIADFEQKYIQLINHIKGLNKNVRVVVVSVEDEETNRHLRNIADSTRTEYQSILHSSLWNPQSIKSVNSFVQSMGIFGSKRKASAYDLAKIFFCCA